MTIRILDQLFWVCSSILIATVNFLLICYGAKNELNLFCIWILGISCYIGLTLVSFFSRYKYIYNQFRKILQKKGRINKSVSIKATFNMFIVVLLLALFIYLVFSSGLLVFFINPVGKSEIFLLTVRVVGGICFFIFTFPIVILFEIFYIYLLILQGYFGHFLLESPKYSFIFSCEIPFRFSRSQHAFSSGAGAQER